MDNWFDIIVIAILLTAGFLAFLKGFVKEIFSLVNWLVAISAAYFLGPLLGKYLAEHSTLGNFSLIVSGTLVFVVVMIAMAIISSKISASLVTKIPGSVNQSLGLAFGLGKMYLIMSLIFGVVIAYYSQNLLSQAEAKKIKKSKERIGPEFVKNSYSYQFLQSGAGFLSPVVDAMLGNVKENNALKEALEYKKTQDKILDIIDGNDINESLNQGGADSQENEKGYSNKDREKINRLIDIVAH